jgi:putative phosphoesterase
MKNIVKIGVLSDTHLHQVTQEFLDIYDHYLADMDLVLHAGDVVSPDLIDFLNRKDFHGVSGNMDPVALKQVLPEKKVLSLAGYRLGLIHGWGSSDGLENRILPLFHDVDIIVYGHSHIASNHVREGVLFFNPGTATGYSASGKHSIGVLELGDTARTEIIQL